MLFKIHFLKSLARYTHLKMIKNTCNGKNRLQEINDNDECYSIEEEKRRNF